MALRDVVGGRSGGGLGLELGFWDVFSNLNGSMGLPVLGCVQDDSQDLPAVCLATSAIGWQWVKAAPGGDSGTKRHHLTVNKCTPYVELCWHLQSGRAAARGRAAKDDQRFGTALYNGRLNRFSSFCWERDERGGDMTEGCGIMNGAELKRR